ncbi:hypothetical protein [Pantoea sp. CCBC3-3-1]|uniref:hypothetical protein n=1 Tax=Pantoea sp. CCBC3-3-1 TaxID=2490851 RepID=UPI0011BDBDF1|nr:hypothetical protein [Pantoea sp. CCBC3-3-1]
MDSTSLTIYEFFLGISIFIFAMIRTGGISFLLRFLFKILRVKFNDGRNENINNEIFDIQLYRLINGIYVEKYEEIYFIEEKRKEGKLKNISFLFAGFFGPVMKGKLNAIDYIAVIGAGVAFMLLFMITANASSEYKNGYATYRFENDEYMFINTERVLDPYKGNQEVNCHDPRVVISGGKNYKETCDYLLNQGKDRKDIISSAIKNNAQQKKTFVSMAASFLILLSITVIGFINYRDSSQKIMKLKEQEIGTI